MNAPTGSKHRILKALNTRWEVGTRKKTSINEKIASMTLAVVLTTGLAPSTIAFASEPETPEDNVSNQNDTQTETREYQDRQEYNSAIDEAKTVPEDAVSVSASSIGIEGETVKTETYTNSQWTTKDENYKYDHQKTVSTVEIDAPDASDTAVVKPGYTETVDYDEPIFDHVDDKGVTVNRIGETISYNDVTVTTTNENKSSSTHVIEVTKKIQVVLVPVLDENGNPITKIKVDEDGNPILVDAFDEDGNLVGMALSDAEGNPVMETVYYADGSPVSTEDIEYTEAKDENGNRLYLDSNNLLTTESTTEAQASADDCDYSKSETVTSIDAGLYKDDQNLLEIKKLLGDYGITAQEMQISEAITNINVGTLVSCENQTGSQSDSVYGNANQGQTMRVENIVEGAMLGLKNAVSEVLLGSGASENQLYCKEGLNPTISSIASDDRTVEDVRTQVAELASELSKNPSQVSIEKYAAEGGDHHKKQLDFTEIENTSDSTDVVYTTLSLGDAKVMQVEASATIKGSLTTELWMFQNDFKIQTSLDPYNLRTVEEMRVYVDYVNNHGYGNLTLNETQAHTETIANIDEVDHDGYLYIYINEDQVAVINIDTSSVGSDAEIDLWKFKVIVKNADGSTATYDGSEGDGKKVSQQIILNFGDYSGTIKSKGSIFGTVIAPNANYVSASKSAGQLVCNSYKDTGGRWFYTGTSVIENKDVITTYYKTLQNMPLWNIAAKEREAELQEAEEVVETIIKEYILSWKSMDEVSDPTGGEKSIEYIYETPIVAPSNPNLDDPEEGVDDGHDSEETDGDSTNEDVSDDVNNDSDAPENPYIPKHSNNPDDKIAYAKHVATNSQKEGLAQTDDSIGSEVFGLSCIALAGAIGALSSRRRKSF